MNTNEKTAKMDMKVKLSILWVVVMFNMLFADVLTLYIPENLEEIITRSTPIQLTEGLMLVMAIIIEIPILMIFLSRVLKHKANRWTNIIASVITIAFIIGMGSTDLHYIFFATIEVVCMLLIVWYAWKLPKQEA